MNSGKLLIVDDDIVVRDSLGKWFESEGFDVTIAPGAPAALEILSRERFDLALVDIKMPGVDGIELQARLKEIDQDMPVVIMTGYASVETAVRALKNGAYDYITKPFDPDELVHLVSNAISHRTATREVVRLRENLKQIFPDTQLIGQSASMKRVMELVETVAPTDATVLITGESGTGKEVVARAIHAASPRRFNPMVVIHCGALTESLLESELFGHERGAFTGAQARKKGKFEVADGGTVFLDEISDISLHVQTDLLRVLQQKEIVRVGDTQQIKVDFRAIAATNKSLEQLVEERLFRPDLYYRLNVFAIDIPPVRSRREDIPLLVDHFLQKFAGQMNRPVQRLSPRALEVLMDYNWPGNVREMENAIERAMLINRETELRPEDFPFQSHPSLLSGAVGQRLEDIEKTHIEKMLQETNWNLSKTARILDIDRTTLYNKIKRYGLRDAAPK
ncbi:sigma-54-dependent transcriptional regulator [Paludibaculum fermentans]|uniref:Sigma-54-dependent Fis family transcriptional regulator n=1 Tax=Paludibaculum fermentans TaxID=1473598 RepID=A0A7S7NRM2_PALFE|nr:sigma-54 dependent transcriptional regulator [Paludibaculum fermentans]QOY88561.1 sigma-54-dependent Fis family transcriptional regulator [Paludibaculum fermentans]